MNRQAQNQIIDLSYPIYDNMPCYPGDPDVRLERVRQMGKDRVNVTKIIFGSHTGTHLDVPSHMIENGNSLDKTDLSHFFGKAVKINISHYNENSPTLLQYNSDSMQYDFSSFQYDGVIIETGWWLEFNDPAKYFGSQRPSIPLSLAKAAANTNIRFFGCDLPSVDKSGEKDKIIHYIFLKKNIIIYENLTNLDKLPENTPFTFIGFPLNLKDTDGSPVRAAAVI